jgi:Protein of unknown function (DUF3071)
MQELRIVAVSEDGSYAVLAVPGRGGRFSLPIDDRLRIVARGQFSRLEQYEIEVESPLRPKEIQDRIRAGETAEEIADAAGVPIERVRRFEGPVLAERAYRAQEAQGATIRRPGDSGPGPRLGDIVAERLAELGTSAEDVQWDSRKRGDNSWQVQLLYSAGGRPQLAEWAFDPRRRHATPADDQAARLSLPEADLATLAPGPRVPGPATATVTPISSRLAAPSLPAEPRPGPPAPRAAEARAAGAAPAAARTAGARAGDGRPAGGPAADTRATQARAPEARIADGGATSARAADQASGDQASGDAAGTARAADARAAEARAAEPDDAAADPQAAPPPPRGRAARRAAGGRSRRSSVPSWDEIMFGTSRQPD